MNITIDQFVIGLETSLLELPLVLGDWENLEDELRAEYEDNFIWLLQNRQEVLLMAMKEERFTDIAHRLIVAQKAIEKMKIEIMNKMKITEDELTIHKNGI